MTFHPARLPAFLLIILAVCAAPAAAQSVALHAPPEQPAKPFQGLFGGNQENPRSRQTLNLTVSLFLDYENNDITAPNADIFQTLNPLMTNTGFYLGGATSAEYTRRWRHGTFSAAGGTAARYYYDFSELTRIRDWGSAAFTYAFGPKTTLSASQGVWYSPYFMNGWFPAMNPIIPGQPVTPGYDNYTYYRPNWQFNTGIDFTRYLTQDSLLNLGALIEYIDFIEKGALPPATYYAAQASARYQQKLTQGLSLRLGYIFRKYRHGLILIPDERTRSDNVDVGVDYQKTLKVAGRKTNLGFSGGLTYVTFQDNTYYTYLIHAYAATALGQKSYANIAYDRNFSFVEGLIAPYTTDAITVNVGGYVNRRMNLNFSGGYTHGTGVATSIGRTYGAWTGVGQIQVAANRNIALFGQAYFYHFDFTGEYPYRPLPTRNWNRWGLRGGVTFWIPILQ